jgi:chaperonin cofactor prefoldin
MDKDKIIEELKQRIDEEQAVKKSEVLLNKELLERIEKLNLQIETLLSINENFQNKIAKLRIMLKYEI